MGDKAFLYYSSRVFFIYLLLRNGWYCGDKVFKKVVLIGNKKKGGDLRNFSAGKGSKTMKDDKTFKVGDKIVRFGQLFRVFKIKKQKNKNKEEKIILFKPYFKTKENKFLVCSIPAASIDKTNIRKPISKKKLRGLLKELSKRSDVKTPIDISKAKQKLTLNNPKINVQILKRLWKEKSDESTNFSKSKHDIFKLAVGRLVEEVAFVGGISLIKARKKIKTALGEE